MSVNSITLNNSSTKPCIINGEYLCGHKIGNGSFGSVYVGININTSKLVAIKLEGINPKHHPQLFHEYKIYEKLSKIKKGNVLCNYIIVIYTV